MSKHYARFLNMLNPRITSISKIKKNALTRLNQGVEIKNLAMTYSHMGKPHTTIGDTSFHF